MVFRRQAQGKMLQKGAASLSHAELLAILIHHGTRDRTALDLRRNY